MSIRLMASDACSSNTRRGRGEVGREQELIAGYASSSSLQPGNVKDGMAPKCFCGKYAICYMSKTDTNPNRLFFRCPLLKVTEAHCKFNLWVDDHIVRVKAGEATRGSDCGKANGISYDALNKLACLLPSSISKASAHQVLPCTGFGCAIIQDISGVYNCGPNRVAMIWDWAW
ncbi:uncharacterized protein DS421_9g270380 [Arachis hypogaea]|nr:uncharacterized protein DS421_9g270380 [Arachis hypogaea]